MGRTHKAGGCLAMLATYCYLQSRGFMPEIHPLVQLLIMYPAASWGSTMPDLDQSFNSLPEKTPVSIAVNKLLYLGKVKHRSWQTHSILTMGLLIFVLLSLVFLSGKYAWFGIDEQSCKILYLLVLGLAVGIGSHLLLDLMTYEGIQLVPKVWLRFFRFNIFKTGTAYEQIIRIALYIACGGIFIIILLQMNGLIV